MSGTAPAASALDVAGAIRRGDTTARAVAEAALAAIARVDPALGSFTAITRERALDEADAVDARVEQRAVDVDEALQRDLVGLHRDLVRLHGDLLGLHGDLLRLEFVRFQAEGGVLALEACVRAVLGWLSRQAVRRGGLVGGNVRLRRLAHRPSTSSTSAASPTGLNGFVR